MKVIVLISLIFYVLSSLLYLQYLKKGNKKAEIAGLLCAWAGLIAHFAFAFGIYTVSDRIPILSLPEAVATFGWTSVLAFILFMRGKGEKGLGVFVLPIASLTEFILLISKIPDQPVPKILNSPIFPIHITFAFLGYAFFTLSWVSGVAYILIERSVKKKSGIVSVNNLPALVRVEDLNVSAISIGFPLLTIAIITGMVWSYTTWGRWWNWDPKEVWTFITWLVYAIPLHLRFTGWRGKKLAYASFAGFLILIFTFVLSSTLFKGYHSF